MRHDGYNVNEFLPSTHLLKCPFSLSYSLQKRKTVLNTTQSHHWESESLQLTHPPKVITPQVFPHGYTAQEGMNVFGSQRCIEPPKCWYFCISFLWGRMTIQAFLCHVIVTRPEALDAIAARTSWTAIPPPSRVLYGAVSSVLLLASYGCADNCKEWHHGNERSPWLGLPGSLYKYMTIHTHARRD